VPREVKTPLTSPPAEPRMRSPGPHRRALVPDHSERVAGCGDVRLEAGGT
jgi:hypothetical protein